MSAFRVSLSRCESAQVQTLQGAARACREFIEANGLGSRDWDGGRVTDSTGKPVATVSYNGSLSPMAASLDPAVVALLQDLDHLQTDLHRALPRGGGPRMRIADVIERLEQIRLHWRTGIRPASTGRPTP